MARKTTTTAADLLFTQGFGTRRECRGIVLAGRLAWEGGTVLDPDREAPPEGSVFTVDGVAWPNRAKVLVALNKPAGYECSARPGCHPSVLSLLPPQLARRGVQPVGRLDQDTTGLLLLTDDGQLLHRLTHPRRHVAKTYRAVLAGPAAGAQVEALLHGVMLRGEASPVRADSCRIVSGREIELVVSQGKYHQVKRMVAAAGNRVESLRRTAFGLLLLPPGLAEGEWAWVSPDEVAPELS